MADGQHPGLTIAMPAAIDGDGFQPEIDGGEMRRGGDTGPTQDRRRQQPAESGRVLQHRELAPGIEGNDGLQHR